MISFPYLTWSLWWSFWGGCLKGNLSDDALLGDLEIAGGDTLLRDVENRDGEDAGGNAMFFPFSFI